MTDSPPSKDHRPAWRTIVSLLLLIASVVVWLPASDVPRLILEQDPVLLGRYSKEQFSVLFFATPALWLAAWLFWRDRWTTREAKFKAVAITFSIVIGVIGVDIIGRVMRTPRYVEESVQEWTRWPGERVDGPVRTRPPNLTYHVTYADEPPHARSYPDAPAGFGTVECTLTTDARGFRNAQALDRADVIIIGDSFAEGSRVDDADAWPALLADALGTPVYGLGISGGRPASYLSNFLVHGAALEPRVAVFMLYEGNDFDDPPKPGLASFNERINDAVKSSPLIDAIRNGLVRTFGPINADADVSHPAFEWMPLRLSGDEGVFHVAFPPKRVLEQMRPREQFKQSAGWQHVESVLHQLIDACTEAGAIPVVVLAPTAPHVLMPLARDDVTPEQLHAFLSVTEDDLPSAGECAEAVHTGLGVPEAVLRDFCAGRGVRFVTLTDALRARAATGEQVYYTYDQHWTRHGHVVAAEEIAPVLSEMLRDE